MERGTPSTGWLKGPKRPQRQSLLADVPAEAKGRNRWIHRHYPSKAALSLAFQFSRKGSAPNAWNWALKTPAKALLGMQRNRHTKELENLSP